MSMPDLGSRALRTLASALKIAALTRTMIQLYPCLKGSIAMLDFTKSVGLLPLCVMADTMATLNHAVHQSLSMGEDLLWTTFTRIFQTLGLVSHHLSLPDSFSKDTNSPDMKHSMLSSFTAGRKSKGLLDL